MPNIIELVKHTRDRIDRTAREVHRSTSALMGKARSTADRIRRR